MSNTFFQGEPHNFAGASPPNATAARNNTRKLKIKNIVSNKGHVLTYHKLKFERFLSEPHEMFKRTLGWRSLVETCCGRVLEMCQLSYSAHIYFN